MRKLTCQKLVKQKVFGRASHYLGQLLEGLQGLRPAEALTNAAKQLARQQRGPTVSLANHGTRKRQASLDEPTASHLVVDRTRYYAGTEAIIMMVVCTGTMKINFFAKDPQALAGGTGII